MNKVLGFTPAILMINSTLSHASVDTGVAMTGVLQKAFISGLGIVIGIQLLAALLVCGAMLTGILKKTHEKC